MKICLFGAGSKTIDENFIKIGYQLGKSIAENNHVLVFGGGNNGMMGSVARGCHDFNAKIIGVMPEWMPEFEELYEYCDDLIFTKDMDDRKLKFLEISDSFIITPGGIGTLDEFFEVLTLKKLQKHDKDIVILNIDNYFDKLLETLKDMIEKNFMSESDKDLFTVTTSIEETMDFFNS